MGLDQDNLILISMKFGLHKRLIGLIWMINLNLSLDNLEVSYKTLHQILKMKIKKHTRKFQEIGSMTKWEDPEKNL